MYSQFMMRGQKNINFWSLTSRVGHRLRVFENRVLKKIFGPKEEAVTRYWR